MIWILLGLACSDYELNTKDDAEEPIPTESDSEIEVTDTETGEPVAEDCDGVDNDGDGAVDEGYDDADGDGVADCVDDECTIEAADPRSEVDTGCEGGVSIGDPPADPWDWTIEWQWTGGAVYATPAVGDLDLDGIPEVVFSSSAGSTVVVDGSSGTTLWSIPGTDYQSGHALGDIDGDGYGDIVATTGSCFSSHTVVAYDNTGTQLWSTSIGTACETYPVIVDLEGDGDVEVVVNGYILDGATGSTVATLSGLPNGWGAPAVADMDQDGVMEIMLENKVFDSSGNLVYTCGSAGGTGSFPQPVNADSDSYGELLVAASRTLILCDDDGSTLWSTSHSSSYGSAVAVADFDNDGEQEFAFAAYNAVRLFERDGTTLWTTTVTDSSGLAGATSWDVDLDGVPEVVYADEKAILVLDGATGAKVIEETSHGSVTLAETPAVADVDGDGQGELLYGSNSGWQGVTVVGGSAGDWPYARPVYNQYSYYGDNIEDDLSVPLTPDAPWLSDANLFRGQPSALYVAGSPNLRIDIHDVCVSSCEEWGTAEVSVQVWNDGGAEVAAGLVIELYGTVSGVLESFYTYETVDPIPSGGSLEFTVTAATEQLGDEVVAIVDPDDEHEECYEDDNQDEYNDLPCD